MLWKNRTDAQVGDDTYSNALICPMCGGYYLHQGNTTIYERTEDASVTTVIAQNGSEVVRTDFPSDDVANPSMRRHGLIIEFECECCHVDDFKKTPLLRLSIYQHKGITFLEWVE